MKANEVKALSRDELPKRLDEKQRELFELRFKASTKQLKNPCELSQVKKDIARLKTEERQRALSDK